MRQETIKSQVAATLALIAAEYIASKRALSEYATVSTHAAINARMEATGAHIDTLIELTGDHDTAMELVVDLLNRTMQEEEPCH